MHPPDTHPTHQWSPSTRFTRVWLPSFLILLAALVTGNPAIMINQPQHA